RNHRVGVGLIDERRRSPRDYLSLVRQESREARRRVFAEQIRFGTLMGPGLGHRNHGITEDGKIGPAAGAIDGIRRIRITGIEMGGNGGRKMAAGGESHDSDAIGRDVPLGGAGAYGSYGA